MGRSSRNGEPRATLTESYYVRHATQLAPAIEVRPVPERKAMIRCQIRCQMRLQTTRVKKIQYSIFIVQVIECIVRWYRLFFTS